MTGGRPMIVITRKRYESIMVNEDIQIIVVDIRGDRVRIGVDAKLGMPVQRLEVFEANREAKALAQANAPPRFKVTTEGANALGLAALCERFANGRWLPAHMLPHEAAESVLDAFKRAVAAELELLE